MHVACKLIITVLHHFPAAPSPPETLQPLSISARNITVTWDLPLNPNGIISFYQIELMSEDGSITQQNSTQTVAVFTSLSPSAPYSIKVQGFTVEFGEFSPVLMVSTLAGERLHTTLVIYYDASYEPLILCTYV